MSLKSLSTARMNLSESCRSQDAAEEPINNTAYLLHLETVKIGYLREPRDAYRFVLLF